MAGVKRAPKVSRKGKAPPIVYKTEDLIQPVPHTRPEPARRPNKMTDELWAEMRVRLVSGETLTHISRATKHYPELHIFYRWLYEDEKRFQDYTRARELMAETITSETMDIADLPQTGEKRVMRDTKDGVMAEITSADMIEHRRLRIEARRWLAAKLAPRTYGDKVQQEHSTKDGKPLVVVMQQGDEKL